MKILVFFIVILVIMPILQARRGNLKKVLAHKDDGEEIDFGEGYVASTSLYHQKDTRKEGGERKEEGVASKQEGEEEEGGRREEEGGRRKEEGGRREEEFKICFILNKNQ